LIIFFKMMIMKKKQTLCFTAYTSFTL